MLSATFKVLCGRAGSCVSVVAVSADYWDRVGAASGGWTAVWPELPWLLSIPPEQLRRPSGHKTVPLPPHTQLRSTRPAGSSSTARPSPPRPPGSPPRPAPAAADCTAVSTAAAGRSFCSAGRSALLHHGDLPDSQGDGPVPGALGEPGGLDRGARHRPGHPGIHLLLLLHLCARLPLPGRPRNHHGRQGLQLRHGLHEESESQ